jgi:glycosyltransferase involved in cell wall biosynthesis
MVTKIGEAQRGLVSVIIPTTNKELPLVEKCVQSIKRSSYKRYEIVVVNEGLERSRQRNIGIARAQGEYLLILDSDQSISPGLMYECVSFMQRGYDAVYIPETIITAGWFGRLRNWERQFYTGTPVDVVRFVRAKDCPLFDVTMSGPEDSDWDRRVQGKRAISRNHLYHHDNVGVISFFNKKRYYSKSMGVFHKHYPNDRVLNFWYRCFWIFMENGKWKRFLWRPWSAFQVLVLIFLRGLIYVMFKGKAESPDSDAVLSRDRRGGNVLSGVVCGSEA